MRINGNHMLALLIQPHACPVHAPRCIPCSCTHMPCPDHTLTGMPCSCAHMYAHGHVLLMRPHAPLMCSKACPALVLICIGEGALWGAQWWLHPCQARALAAQGGCSRDGHHRAFVVYEAQESFSHGNGALYCCSPPALVQHR